MEAKYVVTQADIDFIVRELRRRSFFPTLGLDRFRRANPGMTAIAPGPRARAEFGLVYEREDLAVVVWTSWLPAESKPRRRDCGWVIIEERGTKRYALPVPRREGFAARIVMEARIARMRVRFRPFCEQCSLPMGICYGKGRGSRYWRCPQCRATESWDSKALFSQLPQEAKEHLAKRRDRRERWYEECRANGKPIRAAMMRKKPWRSESVPAIIIH